MQASKEISQTGARENILRRIAQSRSSHSQPAARVPLAAIFPEVGDPRQRFLRECAGNLTEVFPTADSARSAQALEIVLSNVPAGEVYVQDDPGLQPLITVLRQWRPVRLSSQGAPAENTQASLTAAHAFVAQTGSILTSSACGGRGASIVPPCHIVYGRGEQIVSDIAAALGRVPSHIRDASYVGLITGSSRTADIEKILVQGAHGPRRLVVILEG
jgi:L-lactate dehydrogenase complex protein LldG